MLSSSLCIFLHSPVTPSLLGPNILLSALFSNTLSLFSSINVSDQVAHPYKTGKIIFLYISVTQSNLCLVFIHDNDHLQSMYICMYVIMLSVRVVTHCLMRLGVCPRQSPSLLIVRMYTHTLVSSKPICSFIFCNIQNCLHNETYIWPVNAGFIQHIN